MTASPATSAQGKPRVKKRWFAYFGLNSLGLSILLHVLFGVGAAFLIVEHFQKKHVNFHATEPPAQHTEIEHKVELAKRNSEESAPPDLKRIVSTDVAAITLPDPPEVPMTDEPDPTPMAAVDGVMDSGLGNGSGSGNGSGKGSGGGNGTGLEDFPAATDQFAGYFYDFNQTKDKKPTGMNSDALFSLLANYFKNEWDESVLEPYYRSKSPIYARFFATTSKDSKDAPNNFGLEKEVLPNLWIAHYHAKVIPPEAGDYRFIGFADNFLLVKINGETVFEGSWTPVLDRQSLHEQLPWVFSSYGAVQTTVWRANLKMGASFHVEADEPVDMDVVIGDWGEGYNSFLLIKNENKHYDRAPDGTPEVPFFQLGDGKGPTFSDGDVHPPYSANPEPWHTAPNE